MKSMLILGALLVAGCAGHRARHPEAAHAASWERTEQRAVRFLVGHQNPDGSWGTFNSARPDEVSLGTVSSHRAFQVAASSLCCLALVEPSRGDLEVTATLGKGIRFLLEAPPTARANGDTFYDNWAHGYLLQALAVLSRDPRFSPLQARMREVGEREIGILERMQGAEGGWGYYDFDYQMRRPSGMESTSFMTGMALVALHEAQTAGFTVPARMVDQGRKCLIRLRVGSGAYIYGTYAQMGPQWGFNVIKGSLGRSQAGNVALALTGSAPVGEAELRTGLDNFFQHHRFLEIGRGRPYPHEAWYYTAGYYFFFGHYYASRAIDLLPEADRPAFQSKLRDCLLPLQSPDGSFFDFPLYGYHRAYGTAFALMAIQSCPPPAE